MTTERPVSVRVAMSQDEDAILKLMKSAFEEQPIFPLDEHKMREKIRICTDRKGGVVGVIDGPNGLEGYLIAVLGQFWYSDAWHLEELSNFVHPDSRRSTHAKDLISFAKWFAEQMNVPVLLGILSTQRLDAKVRLYQRQAKQVGAIFAHNTGHVGDLLSETG